jgi:hypothetical protein
MLSNVVELKVDFASAHCFDLFAILPKQSGGRLFAKVNQEVHREQRRDAVVPNDDGSETRTIGYRPRFEKQTRRRGFYRRFFHPKCATI